MKKNFLKNIEALNINANIFVINFINITNNYGYWRI